MRARHRSSARTLKRLRDVAASLWWTPLLLGLGGVAAGIALPILDRRLDLGPLPSTSPAESLVSSGAAALATILGVAFSLTLVTLQLAAVQYTSRLLRRFMADRVTRFMLGSYIATISYLLLVLRAIDPDAEHQHLALSVLLALVLFIGCVLLLAVFLHHLARSIQASAVVSAVGKETLGLMDELALDSERNRPSRERPPPSPPWRLRARAPGYVQLVDEEELASAAPQGCRTLRVEARAGQFVLPGSHILSVWPAACVDPRAEHALYRAFAFGSERMPWQDVLHGIRQLVDIALKALSPAINDVTTAMMVINELAVLVHRVTASEHASLPGAYRQVEKRGVLLLVPRLELDPLLTHALDGLPRAAADHPMAIARLLEILSALGESARYEHVRRRLRVSAVRAIQASRRAQLAPWERRTIGRRLEQLRGAPASGAGWANPT